MATETELVELLESIGDRAPSTLDRVTLHAVTEVPPRRRWLPIAAAAAVAAVSVSATVALRSSDSDHGTSAGDDIAIEATVDRATYPLPLDPYYATAKQYRTLQRAQFVLAQRCAKTRGVVVPDADIPTGDAASEFLSSIANNIRPLTLQQARTIGYDMYSSGTSAIDAALKTSTSQEKQLFNGCYTRAGQTLLKGATPKSVPGQTTSTGLPGLFTDDVTVQNKYLNEARKGERTPQVRRAQERWSTCMAAHDYPGLDDTQAAIGRTDALRSAAAKRQAVQDVKCKQSTGFMTVWVSSMIKAQKSVVAEHRSDLDGFKDRLARRLANAADALD